MPRIVGVDIPKEKKIGVSLAYIYGIGRHNSLKILQAAGVSPEVRAKSLTEDEVSRITVIIQKEYRTEGNLKRELSMNIKRLMDIRSYRGIRHKRGLPVRGQRTRTNARTRKGPKKTIGAQRKKETAAARPAVDAKKA
ncbi:MAG: 30S ribosomal protein S13 [Candidatus Omnitrophica bacterium CG07_land_8_20_14_0_80_50_8]|nr:MAG: 30S ribosomal protein S13 [Candidatus Omnitrophica bacterium CG1_02_49_16]PIU40440.1 MAG: 30S ribosomal protein S13 [Candidatus Omnitrophica bacterium CG07_land_8_20_14_0_80_50_8]